MAKNWVAKDLRTPKYAQRVEKDKKKHEKADKRKEIKKELLNLEKPVE